MAHDSLPFHYLAVDGPIGVGKTTLVDKLYTVLEPQIPVPDLVLYLVADLDTCMRRITRRERGFEKNMSEEYMSELIDAYHHYYHYYDSSSLLVVDTRHLNFVEHEADFEELVTQLSKPLKGTQHYVPAGPRLGL